MTSTPRSACSATASAASSRYTSANGYQTATPDTIFRHFIEGPGELQFTPEGVNVALRARAHTPVLLDAGYQDRTVKIPWWEERQLSYSFPPA